MTLLRASQVEFSQGVSLQEWAQNPLVLSEHANADSGVHGVFGKVVGTTDAQVLTNKELGSGSLWKGDPIGVQFGGTGLSSFTAGDLIVASGQTTLATIPAGSTGQVLTIQGGIPVWSTFTVPTLPTFGTIASQNANAVTITGGSISGITDLAVADGGTGASTASEARANLGLIIGTNIAPVVSPAFTGVPSAPTAATGTNTTQIATTAYVLASGAAAQTLSNKIFTLGANTLTGSLSQFNAACTDADFVSIAGAEVLSNKTFSLGSNTLTGSLAQFNAACSDADFATLAGIEGLTNKTLGVNCTYQGNPVTANYGGTGQSSYSIGNLLYATGATTLGKLAIGAEGQVLTVAGGVPTWQNASGGGSSTGVFGSAVDVSGVYNYTTSTYSPVKIGLTSDTSNSPALWIQTKFHDLSTDYTAKGVLIDVERSGTSPTTSVGTFDALYVKAKSFTTQDYRLNAIHGVADVSNCTSCLGGAAITALWPEVMTASTRGTGAQGYYGMEINMYQNFTGGEWQVDPFNLSGGAACTNIYVGNVMPASGRKHAFVMACAGGISNTFTRDYGFFTGIYLTDISDQAIRINGGVYGASYTSTAIGIEETGTFGTGFKLTGQATTGINLAGGCSYGLNVSGTVSSAAILLSGNIGTGIYLSSNCGTVGINLGPNKLNWGTGSGAGTVSNNGDMLYNDVSKILYFNQGSVVTEGMFSRAVYDTADVAATKKIRVKIGTELFDLLAVYVSPA